MNIWMIFQLTLNLIFFAGILFLLIHRKQSHREDQKFSKGLQLLQNKISILEDLSDQTDTQVKSLTKILEEKYKEVQGLLVETDQQIQRMEDVAQNTWNQIQSFQGVQQQQDPSMNKYVKAAQMANSGAHVDEILRTVDLTRGEVELIVAMNKDQLVFNQNKLPLWVNPEKAEAPPPQGATLGSDFLKALKQTPAPMSAPVREPVSDTAIIQQNGKTMAVKPFEFKKITM